MKAQRSDGRQPIRHMEARSAYGTFCVNCPLALISMNSAFEPSRFRPRIHGRGAGADPRMPVPGIAPQRSARGVARDARPRAAAPPARLGPGRRECNRASA